MVKEEVAQSYGGGEIAVSTEELNPVLQRLWFEKAGIVEYPLYENGKVNYGVVLDLSSELPDRLVITIKNEGDENLDYGVKAYIDGNKILDTFFSQPVGEISKVGVAVPSAGFEMGEHTCECIIRVKRAGAPSWDYRTYYHDKVTYSCYTKALNAICTKAVIVQGGKEKHWLTGDPSGFTESEVAILPDAETFFKFYLSNSGDEAVKMNVGHVLLSAESVALPQIPLYTMSKVNGEWEVIKGEPVRSNYNTGFMVGGVLLDTIEKNVAIPAGNTSEITTQRFISSLGVLAIGDIVILRAFHIILPECEQEFRVYDRQGNPISDGWTLVVEVYEEDGETLMEVRTKPVVNGACVISLPEDRYVRAWAEKGEERTTGWSLGAGILCRSEPFKFYLPITCDEAEHYPSGRGLLEHYDTDSDGVLTKTETVQAIMDGLDETINIAETVFVAICYEDYSGVINDMCPPS